jgi:hypothetical protein
VNFIRFPKVSSYKLRSGLSTSQVDFRIPKWQSESRFSKATFLCNYKNKLKFHSWSNHVQIRSGQYLLSASSRLLPEIEKLKQKYEKLSFYLLFHDFSCFGRKKHRMRVFKERLLGEGKDLKRGSISDWGQLFLTDTTVFRPAHLRMETGPVFEMFVF